MIGRSLCAALLASAVSSGTALAQDPPTPPPTPPPPAGDQIKIEDEPAGENCKAGGVKITVTHPPAEPDGQPVAEVSYVCNGVDSPTEPEDPGLPADPVENLDSEPLGSFEPDSLDSFNPPEDNVGTIGPTVSKAQACSSARVVNLRLPRRFRQFQFVTLVANRAQRAVTVRRRRIKVDLRGVRCGTYLILVRHRRVESALQLWRLTANRIVRRTIH